MASFMGPGPVIEPDPGARRATALTLRCALLSRQSCWEQPRFLGYEPVLADLLGKMKYSVYSAAPTLRRRPSLARAWLLRRKPNETGNQSELWTEMQRLCRPGGRPLPREQGDAVTQPPGPQQAPCG